MIRHAFMFALVACLITTLNAQQTSHTLMDGTPVKLRLAQTMSSADAKVGQEVPFEVVDDLKVDDVVVLPKGATATGTVIEAKSKKSMGRAGRLNISISHVRLSDRQKVALRAIKESKGVGRVGTVTSAMVISGLTLWPVAPFFLFIHGKDTTMYQGTEITAFVDGDTQLDLGRIAEPPVTAPAAATTQASLVVESTPPVADIEVDGAFVGSTPSTVSLAPGSHNVSVKKKGFVDWTRTVNVTGKSVHLNAELEQKPEK